MSEKIKVLIDTDVCNEIDDQFAICYALANAKKLNILGFTICPFRDAAKPNLSIRDGLIDSKNEANHILRLFGAAYGKQPSVFLGCDGFLSEGYDGTNPAVEKIISLAKSEEKFVVCCLGPLTNVAMAIRLEPKIAKNLDIVWLGTGNILLDKFSDSNFVDDKDAFYEVLKSKARLTVLPSNLARGIVTSKYEFFENSTKNNVTDFLKSLFDRFDYIKKEKEIKSIYDIAPIAYVLHQKKFAVREIDAKLLDKENAVKLPANRNVLEVLDLPKNSFVWLDFLNSINSIKDGGFKPQTFFISDTHFGQERKVKIKEVPFKSVEEMNEEIIRRWNNKVGPQDVVYHLGDFGDYELVKRLNGKIILICGNYEHYDFNNFKKFREKLIKLGFLDVVEKGMYLDESVLGERVFLTHKPSNHAKSGLTLFGHVHSLKLLTRYGFNVCCAYHNFAPITAASVKKYLNFIKNHADRDVFV